MLVSALHRIAGVGLSVVGLVVLTWWLVALAKGPEDYSTFLAAAGHPLGTIVLIGLSWAFFQHLLSGIRFLIMDTGAAFELGISKTLSVLTMIGSVAATAAMWFYILGVRS